MNTILVLAMHGAPPKDFPSHELAEYMSLHHQLEYTHDPQKASRQRHYKELKDKMLAWPRNSQNDPFFSGSTLLAQRLETISGLPVILGFNEFCSPSLDDALEQAASAAELVLVITPMMTRGGEHAEQDIPASITRVQEHHPNVDFRYLWPFDVDDVARFLSEKIRKL